MKFHYIWLLLLPAALPAAVAFDDPLLERAMLEELGRNAGPVSEGELAGLTELDVAFRGITSLGGLEGAASLERLNLFGNTISDLGPLASLTTLEDLDLGANAVSDLTPLAGLSNLTWLRIDLNPVGDFTPLSGLLQLVRLSLNGTGTDSLDFIAGMGQLVRLSAASNRIADASLLATACPLLEELNLSGNLLTSARFITDLPILTAVDLQDNYLLETGWPQGAPVASVTAGQWVHAALVIDGGPAIEADSLKVYVDGELLGSAAGSQLWSHGADIGIGAMVYQTCFPDIQPDGDGYSFDGSIDDVRIYHRALGASEIAALASGSGPTDMAVYWPMDGNAQDTVASNNGSTNGNATFGTGLFGQALVVDGSGDSVSVPDSTDINLRTSAAYTVSLFFKADNPDGARQILYEQGGRTRGLNLYVQNGLFIAGAWNDIAEESSWAGAWVGESAAGQLARLNLSGNQLESLPIPVGGVRAPDWDLSHNRFPDLDDLVGLTGPGSLRTEGNFFDPQTLPMLASLVAAGMDVFGRTPSSFMDYPTWRSVFFLPVDAADDSVSGPLADPDRDGLVNELECAFGGDPLVPDAGRVAPVLEKVDGIMEFRYRDRSPAIQLQVRQSTTLEAGSWLPSAAVPVRDPFVRGWRLELAAPGFLRLESSR